MSHIELLAKDAVPATPLTRWMKVGFAAGVGVFGSILLVVPLAIVIKLSGADIDTELWPRIALYTLGGVFVLSAVVAAFYVKVILQGTMRKWVTRPGWQSVPEPDEAVREIRRGAALLNEQVAKNPKFPGRLLCDARVRRPAGVARVAVPPLFSSRKRSQNSMLMAVYVWVPLPQALPGLVLTKDVVPGSASHVSDINLENDAFNRRYQVGQWSPTATGERQLERPAFQRYGSAVLTPRIVEQLLAVQRDQLAIMIRDDRLMALALLRPDAAEAMADALLQIAALIPPFVYSDYGREAVA